MDDEEVTFQVGHTVDIHVVDFLNEEVLASSSSIQSEIAKDTVIAPWLASDEEPPSPPPPPPPPKHTGRSFGFVHKPSLASFSIPRQTSVTNLLPIRNGRASESHSVADSSFSDVTTSTETRASSELHKAKSTLNIFTTILKKSRSRARLRSDTDHIRSYSQSQTFLAPTQDSLTSLLPIGPTSPSSFKREKSRSKRKEVVLPPQPPPEDTSQHEWPLDTNIAKMDGIIDPAFDIIPVYQDYNSSLNSSFGRYRSGGLSNSDTSVEPSPITSMFSNLNPFQPTTVKVPRLPVVHLDYRKISPKTVPPTLLLRPSAKVNGELPDSPSWTAPESWAVEKDGDEVDDPRYSSSDDARTTGNRPMSLALKRKSRRKTMRHVDQTIAELQSYKIRIYRANGTFHVASVPLSITVAELTPVLNQKVIIARDRVTHKLYLRERGRERVLAPTEKPAAIVRRRLEQAGYDPVDGLERMGRSDISFLLRFQYKSQSLGQPDEDLVIDSNEYVDLSGRSLLTIPVVLHKNASTLVTLTLSRNPMLEIPLDFIQACTTLRELRLSHMAMKKVPQSVRHSVTLHHLDISCNRIADLDDAGLDRIPELRSLKAQNNRMEKLPWYFPRLRSLKYLNISNNKFQHLPAVVSEMTSLMDLDISFNMISELPEEIGQLTVLERLIMVGNQVSKFPDECSKLVSLKVLDCRRNMISDLSVVCMLPCLEAFRGDHNAVHALDLSLGPCVTSLDASHNDITRLTPIPSPGCNPYALRSLDISHAKLSSLDDLAFSQLSSLQYLRIDHNSIRFIPESLGELSKLVLLSCSANELVSLPFSIGRLQRLETLDTHSNSLTELPASIWNCASLSLINATSNLLGMWHPPIANTPTSSNCSADSVHSERKTSSTSTLTGRFLPPLAHSLERLYLGENQFTDDGILPLMILKELCILNLSFNELSDIPTRFFRRLTQLQELYLSGNKLTTIPTEDLHLLTHLSVLFLNGNRLQTLPQEIKHLQSLSVLDVGSNLLKYNINNVEFDWNWNFNRGLTYLNFSGNKRLKIKPDTTNHRHGSTRESEDAKIFADFSKLTQLRVLGLMDVTTTFVHNVPDDNEERRVRTSLSTVNSMAYGIADNLGKYPHLNMLDLVQPEFHDRKDEAIFAMFGRPQHMDNNRMSRFLHDNFVSEFTKALDLLDSERGEGISDALRRTFLHLNKRLHDKLFSPRRKTSQGSDTLSNESTLQVRQADNRTGTSGIVLYFVGKTMYVANAGDALAVISQRGKATPLSRKHDPFDRRETSRIRAAEGWVSPKGYVNDEVDVSRSFGFYHLFPVINARPDICAWPLCDLDEFVIIGNRGLWDYVDYQTAVDIARSERADPMIAAQKLRDFAISYGAEISTMIMVISVGDLFTPVQRRPNTDMVVDFRRARKKDEITIRNISRLDGEVSPPTGHVALVFTDIRNSTHLWEANPGTPTAMRLHNNLLRRQLRFCGGYEVKTEGDAFMCSFPTALSALWWSMTVQSELLKESWPLEILECEDGKEIYDANGTLIARGLSVRMGIHSGQPLCEPDPITKRMDYFGSMVNRAARISGRAAGGQIMVSADVTREINAKINETEPETEYSEFQPLQAILAIKSMGVSIVSVGEVKLKGIEVPETLSIVYPNALSGRQDLEEAETLPSASGSRVQFSVEQIRALALLCVRLETLTTGRIFRSLSERKRSVPADAPPSLRRGSGQSDELQEEMQSVYVYGDPNLLFPTLSETASDADLMMILESLSIRIMNALPALCLKAMLRSDSNAILDALAKHGPLGEETLVKVLAALNS